ncbi:MAG: carboxypeptidase-like regulatory domain-containing protein [Paludibacter sp.]
MKHTFSSKSIIIFIMLFIIPSLMCLAQNNDNYSLYKAIVIDKNSGDPLAYAGITIEGTNYSTVSNSDGEFAIKLLSSIDNAVINIQFIGYKSKSIHVKDLKNDKNKIELEPVTVELPEISVISKDAESLVISMLEKKGLNYGNQEEHLTAFYRESIRRNKTYASLSEAVVDVYKQSYNSYKSDIVKIYKARKKTDYSKLDTLVFKLQGGPFNSLYLDLMKNPEMIFTDKMLENYEFIFDRSTRIGKRLIYVVDFKQKKYVEEPLYYGKLYIDAQSLALKTATFKLNLANKEAASQMFIVKKPYNADAYPIETNYRIDFLEKDNKWYYGYSRIELGLRINWKKKLFNTSFYSTIEMAVTDKDKSDYDKETMNKDRIRPQIVIADEVSGFADPDFWGEFNVIEPEKPIEAAIRKIQKQLIKK